ncbi:OmpA family protein [Hymenobacter sp. 5516J-16]|uniref:OmpA family protein n=1 Tax=Hymenobacter sp. 5516J-16 TaxID=2932253 RepID=UPI00293E0FB8|nr:OmpA family protein [Hymenobacter sp. 5516J-16]
MPAAAQQQLRNLANILRAFPRARIQVSGYSDSLDGQHSTQALSEERARAAVRALRGFGIGANRLQARASAGPNDYASPATDEAGNYYHPYLSLQFVGNLPAGVIVRNPASAALAGKPRSSAASRAAARLHTSKSAQARARRAARLRRLRAKKQHRARKKLWFQRLGQRIRGERASR